MRPAVLIPGLFLIGAGALAVTARADEAPKTTLSGRFTLNAAESEDAREKMRQARGGDGGQAGEAGGRHGGAGRWGGAGGGGHRRPDGGGPGGAGGPGGGSDAARESMRAVFEAPAELTITDTGNEVVILEKDGRMRTLHPDGRSMKNDASGDEVKTRRDGERLVVETKTARGGKVTETFVRDVEHHRIQQTLVLEPQSRPSLSILRVYDEAPPES